MKANDLKAATDFVIRDAGEADMAQVQRIYAHHVLHGSASFEEAAPSLEEMLARRREVIRQGLPYLVAAQE